MVALSMNKVVLLQLPVPQTNFGRQTGNTPLAAAWLKASLPAAAAAQADTCFESLPSPYLSGLLEPGLSDVMLLETQL
jgi:hypothetical protein